jgi:Ca2+-binding RTX toxin-like protein
VTGSAYADDLTGDSGANVLKGQLGDDILSGLSGSDELWGGDDDDHLNGGNHSETLIGGSGTDTMIGGDGADDFKYHLPTDSPFSSGSLGDRILDFERGLDVLDFTELDANPATIGKDTLAFVGGAFTGNAGELAIVTAQLNGVSYSNVLIDLDGDAQADMDIWVKTTDGLALGAGDLIL